MARYSRPQAAYPGEWAFILGAKLVTAAPAHERQESKREAEAVAEAAAAAQNHDGIHELLEKVNEGKITGTHHLHVSVTLGLSATNGTRLPMITAEPTGDGDESDDDEDSLDSDDGEHHSDHPTPTGDPALESSSALPELDDGTVVAEGDGPNKGAIAGGVIGALLFLSLLLGLFLFRRRIRQKIVSRKYNRMGPTPDPMVITRYVEAKPGMSERRGPLRTLFGSKATTSGGGRGGEDMGLPPPAMIRYSTTTSRRESRSARYFRSSLLRGPGDAPGSPPDPRGTFYNPHSSSPTSDRSHSPPQFRSLSRANSDRFPIAIPPTSAPSSTSTSPTLADGFFHALSQPKAPLQAPQPVAIIPAFLIPETPVEPKDSHFSWSTTKTPQVPPTPGNQIRSSRVSSAESEPKFRGVNSWVSNQRGRLERQGGMARQSQASLPPQTPKEFKVHPGRQVSYGTGGERIMSEDLDRVINGDRQSKGSRRFS